VVCCLNGKVQTPSAHFACSGGCSCAGNILYLSLFLIKWPQARLACCVNHKSQTLNSQAQSPHHKPQNANLQYGIRDCDTFKCHTAHLTPHTSHLTPHTSQLTPHTSHLTPHTSHLTPHNVSHHHDHRQQQHHQHHT